MLLHTIVVSPPRPGSGAAGLTREDAHFLRFIVRDIFPGGQLTLAKMVKSKAAEAGFELRREHALGPHYARTLDEWADRLIASREQAIALSSQETYEKYVEYLTGSSSRFEDSRIDVVQFTLTGKSDPMP
ncbi:unannotated protein [freshwater metagenome]|uniref:Unannotated protein n=1 Tax=freshwater metagenome TaxID=449393 RepID=A0A6J7J5P1_9ZZZZ